MQAPQPGNKYIVGWVTLRDGTEAEFDRILSPYVAACRQEEDCRFFEMVRSRERRNTVVICECFVSEEAHAVHLGRPHVKAFFDELHKIALVGQFENVIAAQINADAYNFVARKPL
jgi:quinol monooxygenase YgiN